MDCDILCLQEHWLHGYEMNRLTQLFPQWNHNSVTYDSTQTIDDTVFTHHRSGRGGVATLWKGWLDTFAERIQKDSTDRIVVTTFRIPSRPLCIINCYLSSGRTSTCAITAFMEDMDRIDELIHKYSGAFEIILVRDLNASLSSPSDKGKTPKGPD